MKYFVLSDVHNHFTEMKTALDEAGFDIEDQYHKVILVGDAFDRGEEAAEVFTFLKELVARDKLIWVAGNHEFFILKRFKEGCFTSHKSTYSTMLQIAQSYCGKDDMADDEVMRLCRETGFEEFIKNNIVGYFETSHYVFVHGSLPTIKGELDCNWRNVELMGWCRPAMQNGMKSVAVNDIRVPGKTVVCGHSPSAYGNVRSSADPEDWDDKKFDSLQRLKKDRSNSYLYHPYYGDGVIGIDANCYKTGFVNCIVLEEEEEYGE